MLKLIQVNVDMNPNQFDINSLCISLKIPRYLSTYMGFLWGKLFLMIKQFYLLNAFGTAKPFKGENDKIPPTMPQRNKGRVKMISNSSLIRQNVLCQNLSYSQHINIFQIGKMFQLQQLITQLSKDNNHLKALKLAKKFCCFEEAQLKILEPSSVLLFIMKLNGQNVTLSQEILIERKSQRQNFWGNRWHPYEYKHFMWLIFGYFYIKNTLIAQFGEQDIDFFSNVFPKKQRIFLQYHLMVLIKQNKSNRETWSKQETELLCQVINSEKHKGKWNNISYMLYFLSKRAFFKTSHKCREMWFNHLNPNVNHHKWTLDQDIQLFQQVSSIGTKWARISQAMGGVRTEHMVKNRFKSLMKKYNLKYQKYSLKRLAQIIQKDLQVKLINQERKNVRDRDLLDKQISDQVKIQDFIEKQQILFIQTQKNKNDKNQQIPNLISRLQSPKIPSQLTKAAHNNHNSSSSLTEKNPVQNKLIIPEFTIQREKPVQKDDATKNLQCYEIDFQNMNNIQNEGEVIHMQWTVMYKVNQVELIDYLGIDYQFKPTIFSGAN